MRSYTQSQLSEARQRANLLHMAAVDVALFDISGDKQLGAEYRGPCPFCQIGHDRFVVFTEGERGRRHNGRFKCRVCGKHGDGLQYLMYKHAWSLPEAVNYVTGDDWQPPAATVSTIVDKPAKKRSEFDYELWRERLEPMLYHALDDLAQMKGKGATAAARWLAERGIGADVIGRYGLGFNPEWKNLYDDFRLPPGLLIPRWQLAPELPVAAVNVYLSRQYHEKYGRRRFLRGSNVCTAFGEHLITQETTAVWITEGELDAACLSQFLPEGYEAISWGGNECFPNKEDYFRYFDGHTVYLCLDNDDGGRQALAEWQGIIPRAIVASVPSQYKDLTDCWRASGNEGVRAMVKNSLILPYAH